MSFRTDELEADIQRLKRQAADDETRFVLVVHHLKSLTAAAHEAHDALMQLGAGGAAVRLLSAVERFGEEP